MNVFGWNARQRTWAYRVAFAVVAVIGGLGWVDSPTMANLGLLAAALFAPTLALRNITPDQEG